MDTSLHGHAVQAEAALEQLATGMAHAGVDQGTVKAVSQMAAVVRKIVVALGSPQGQEQAPAQAQPAPAGQGSAPTPQQPHTLDSATTSLHQDMQASARR